MPKQALCDAPCRCRGNGHMPLAYPRKQEQPCRWQRLPQVLTVRGHELDMTRARTAYVAQVILG